MSCTASQFLRWCEVFGVSQGGGGNIGPVPSQQLLMWLDAANPLNNGTVPITGASLGTWYDKSGNANNATFVQGSAGSANFFRNQLNGLPCLSIDARSSSGQCFSLAPNLTLQAPGVSIYAVYQTELEIQADAPIIALGSSSSNYLEISPNASSSHGRQLVFAANTTGASASFYTGVPATLAAPYCDTYIFGNPSSTWVLANNGVNQAITSVGPSGGLPQPSGLGITGNNFLSRSNRSSVNNLTCNYFEILVYGTIHTAAQQTQVQNYLLTKWGFGIPGDDNFSLLGGGGNFSLLGGGTFKLLGNS